MKLSYKLSIVIILVALGSISIAMTMTYTSIRGALEKQIMANQEETAVQLLDKTDRFLYGRTLDIRGLAQQGQIQSFISNRITTTSTTTAQANLQSFRELSPSWNNFSVLDLTGNVKATTDTNNLGPALLNRAPHLRILYDQAKTGQIVTSDVYRLDKNQPPTMAFLAPVHRDNVVVGIVEGEISWSALMEIYQNHKDLTLHLVTADGLALGGSAPESLKETLAKNYQTSAAFRQAKSSKIGSVIGPSIANPQANVLATHATEAGFRDYPGKGWRLILERPLNAALGPAQQLTLLLLGTLLISVAIGIVLILYLISRYIVSPVKHLSAAVARVTLGDLTQTVPVTSSDELGALGRNFNEMTYQLAVTHRSLKASTEAAEQGRAQLESSINGLRQGFILTDKEGTPLMVNIAAQELVHQTTKSRSKKVKLTDIAALLPASLKLADQVLQTITSRQPAKYPDLPLGGRFLNLYLSPVVHEDNAIGCVLLLEDITEERILQRSRDEFFSIASHELRTPLTAIRGNTSMIQDYYSDQLKDPSLSEMVTDIHESAVRLIEIVNDFLDASRLEQGKMQFTLEAFDLGSVIEKIIYEMAGVSRDKQLYLKFEHNPKSLPMVYADQNRVKQIIYNLVGNAMKFTQKGGVTIEAQVDKNILKILVHDTGQGISPEGQQILFHKFQQSTSSILTRDNTRGTGLGLYISKLLLQNMNGTIQLERTEVGKGTTFSFTLPLATPEQIAAPTPTPSSPDAETAAPSSATTVASATAASGPTPSGPTPPPTPTSPPSPSPQKDTSSETPKTV